MNSQPVKVTSQQLYAEMDRATPGWRNAGHPNFDAAVLAAGPEAKNLCGLWKKAFAKRTDSRLSAKDAQAAAITRLAQLRHQDEEKESFRPSRKEKDTPVFEHSSSGRHLAAEWMERMPGEFQPGWVTGNYWCWNGHQTQTETLSEDDHDDSQRLAVSIGRQQDTLHHPDRYQAAPWKEDFPAYVWNPVAPRSYNTSGVVIEGSSEDRLEFQARARAMHTPTSPKSY